MRLTVGLRRRFGNELRRSTASRELRAALARTDSEQRIVAERERTGERVDRLRTVLDTQTKRLDKVTISFYHEKMAPIEEAAGSGKSTTPA